MSISKLREAELSASSLRMARESTAVSTIEPLSGGLYGSHIKQNACHRPRGHVKLARPFSYYVSELEVRQSKSRRPRGCRNIFPVVAYRPMSEEEYNARLKMLNRKSQFTFRAVVTPYQPM